MAQSFDYTVSSLLCAEDNDSIFYDEVDCGAVEDFEPTWHHSGNHQISNQNHNFDGEEDPFTGLPLQSDECLALMVKKEFVHLPNSGYLNRLRNGGLDLGARKEAVDWIGKVHAHFNFGPLCAYLSVSYFDRFLSAYELPKGKAWMMQLLAVACLSLAAKMEETEVPLCLDLQVSESKFVFEARTIQKMELLVLSTLKWRMQAVTPFSFIDNFLRKINGDKILPRSSIFRSTQLILSIIKASCSVSELQNTNKMDRISSTAILPDTFSGARDDMTEQIMVIWGQIKAPLIVPLLRLAMLLCLVMSLMLFIERLYMGVVITFISLFGRKPEKKYKFEPIKDDVELGNSAYPLVLVQIPMFNEKEVYQLSIGAACGLSWPNDRVIIQVLDDSTDHTIKEMVELECQRWASKGINIKYEIRDNRNGYKAGALKEGLKRDYVRNCDYVVIFDADFQPEPDFLWRTIPYLVHNPELGLVQTRWKFVNADECLMTRMQEMSLDYHFTVEQEVGSSTYAFFGFNGTAGVWRIAAINEAGGWKDRTTVEDMDLAVRASLKGWKFLYLGTVKVKNELPSTFKAYRFQQHRWSCGPANLFRKMVMEIIMNKRVTLWKKVHVIYSFFLVRKIVAHIVTFVFYCVVLPATVLVPEVVVPKWASVYIPSIITILNAVGTPRSLHLLVFWILFENVMSLHRTKATFIGLLEAGRVNEWVVTEKLGDALKTKAATKAPKRPRFRIGERIHLLELGTGLFLFFCGCYDIAFGKNHYFIYLYVQAMAFFVIGFGYVGTFVPNS